MNDGDDVWYIGQFGGVSRARWCGDGLLHQSGHGYFREDPADIFPDMQTALDELARRRALRALASGP